MKELKNKEIIEKLTLEEKAALLSGKDFWQTLDIDRLGIPSIFLSDGPNGIRKQEAAADHLGLNESLKATCFPTSSSLACTWNTDLCEEEGKLLSKEAKKQKVNILLGPGVNIKRDLRCGRNFEYFSEDPYLTGKLAARLVKGIQNEGNSACLKHFACNSQELRRKNVDSLVDERALRELYLTQFEIAIKEGKPLSIMSSYNPVNGEYANENHHLCNDILRGEWGFDGLMVSDWGGVDNRVEGVVTGNDLEMPTTAGDSARDVVRAVKEGKLDENDVNACVDRLLNIVFSTSEKLAKETSEPNLEAHHKLAQKVAEESIVMLENDGTLPLKKKDKVAFIGKFVEEPRYQGAGSSQVNAYHVDKVLESSKSFKFDYIGYEPGFDFKGKVNKGLENKAIELAKKADVVVVFVGLDNVTEAEGLDRENIVIPSNQLHLMDEVLKLGKKVVAVIYSGSVVELPFAKKVNAMLHVYLPGEAGSSALVRIINGEANPSGKLAESYPLKLEDSPAHKYFHMHPNMSQYRESIFVGYRYYDTAGKEVLYPFGYGLSYSTFDYKSLEVSENCVKFSVINNGPFDGKETVQLYVGKSNSKFFRAKKELKGFKKIDLKNGEGAIVEIPFDEYTFRYFNVKTNKWEIEPGTYDIYVGSSSNDIRLTGKVVVEGTTDMNPYEGMKLPSYEKADVLNVSEEEFEVLYGKKIPDHEVKFYKKNRLVVDYWTTVEYLRYARGWSGRLFAWAIRFVVKLLALFGQKATANTLVMGVYHEPMRGLSRMTGGAIHWEQLDGLILMFNGHFFKGVKTFLSEGKKLKKSEKSKQK